MNNHLFTKAAFIAAFFVLAFVLPASAHLPGRMTGGGSIQCGDVGRVTYGFVLHCIFPEGTLPIEPDNLEINWGGGNHFHLTALTTAVCTDNPVIHQQPPSAPFNTMEGTGTGLLNGVPGATILFILTDAGEPGAGADMARFLIKDAQGKVVLDCPLQVLDGGNNQAHKANP